MIRRPPRSTQSRSSAASDVYKRQRENSRTMRDVGYREVVDLAVNQTLTRTIATSTTTLLPVIALLLWGGSVLRGFSLVLLIGIVIGTFSSLFIMSPLIVWFKERSRSGVASARRRKAHA